MRALTLVNPTTSRQGRDPVAGELERATDGREPRRRGRVALRGGHERDFVELVALRGGHERDFAELVASSWWRRGVARRLSCGEFVRVRVELPGAPRSSDNIPRSWLDALRLRKAQASASWRLTALVVLIARFPPPRTSRVPTDLATTPRYRRSRMMPLALPSRSPRVRHRPERGAGLWVKESLNPSAGTGTGRHEICGCCPVGRGRPGSLRQGKR